MNCPVAAVGRPFRSAAVLALLLGLFFPAFALAQSVEPNVRGVVRAPSRIELTTDLSVPVVSAPFQEGATFKKGESLIVFACDRYDAELRAARAGYAAAATELKQKRHLLKYGATGRGDVDLASAQTNRASAEIDAIKARMADCTIEAPFDGRVVQLAIREAQMPSVGQPLLTIIDNSRLEIELVVPSKWLRWIEPGSTFNFEVDETGMLHTARVDRVGAEVDPVSQTVTLYAVFTDGADKVLAGMSGNAQFDIPDPQPLTGAVQ